MESEVAEQESRVHSTKKKSRRWRGVKLSSRARDSVETLGRHCLQRALKRKFHIKLVILKG